MTSAPSPDRDKIHMRIEELKAMLIEEGELWNEAVTYIGGEIPADLQARIDAMRTRVDDLIEEML